MKIGVFVGSFNPVHKSHIKMARLLVDKKYVDKLLMIPTNNYWDKQNIIDLKYRIDMLKMYENDKIIIDTKHNTYEYTYEVMNELKKEYPDSNLCLVIGADNIINFDKWKNYQELLNYELIIFNRNNINIKYYLDKYNKKEKYTIIELENDNISSTLARKNINNREALKEYLDDKIIDYIIKNNIYGK